MHDSSKQTNNQVNYSSKDSELVQSALFNKSHSIIQKEENVKRESKRFNTSQKKISLDIFEYEDRKGKALQNQEEHFNHDDEKIDSDKMDDKSEGKDSEGEGENESNRYQDPEAGFYSMSEKSDQSESQKSEDRVLQPIMETNDMSEEYEDSDESIFNQNETLEQIVRGLDNKSRATINEDIDQD